MNDQTIEQEIQTKGANVAPRITAADVEANIVAEYYFTAAHGVLGARAKGDLIVRNPGEVSGPGAEMLTFCVLQLRNGTRIVGTNYGAIDPAQHSAEHGRADARAQAVEQIWPLMGYELRSKLAAEKSLAPGLRPIDTAPTDGTVFLGYRERDGRWGECYRIQRDDCEMWGFGGESAAAEEWPGFKPTHWMPLPGKQNQTCVAVVDPAVTGG